MSVRNEAAAMYPLLTTAGRDERAWAKRIIYREERRDSTLTPIQVEMARKALDMPLDGKTPK